MFDKSLFAQLEDGSGYSETYDNCVLNPYVNFHNHNYSQALARSLVAESVQMKGVEVYYIRREFVNLDKIFGEDIESKFNKAFKVAMYLTSYDGYEGQRDFFSKFGMSVNDEAQFTVSPQLFNRQGDGQKAREGDLVYFPMNKTLFEVTWVEPNQPFLQLGQESQYLITVQKFVYSGEEIKPEFNASDYIFDATELDPVRNLDNRSDIKFEEYEEDNQVHEEGEEFIEEFDVLIGTGQPQVSTPYQNDDPFADMTI